MVEMEKVSDRRYEVKVAVLFSLSVLIFEFSALGYVIQYDQLILTVTDCGHESLGIHDIFIIHALNKTVLISLKSLRESCTHQKDSNSVNSVNDYICS